MESFKSNFRSSDVPASQDYVLRTTGTHRLDVSPQAALFEFAHQEVVLDRLSLIHVDFSPGVQVKKLTRASYFTFQFVNSGNCALEYANNESHHAGPGDLFVVPPDTSTQEYWPDKSSQFILRIEQDELEAASRKAFGSSQSGIQFKRVYRDPGIAVWLSQILQSFNAGEASGEGLLGNHHVRRHLGQGVLMMLLTGLERRASTNIGSQQPKWVPYYVRRAEKYFQQHFADNVSMENLVADAGVSARTLFYGFRHWLGTTPMNYLRDLRLDFARNELRKGQTGNAIVSSVALSAGFTNFGQFSKLYRVRFSEKPSATLLRARN